MFCVLDFRTNFYAENESTISHAPDSAVPQSLSARRRVFRRMQTLAGATPITNMFGSMRRQPSIKKQLSMKDGGCSLIVIVIFFFFF
jgi:hypothetical protein